MSNRRAKMGLLETELMMIIGDRGAGKSCFMALVAEVYKKAGYPVFCQYPYNGCNVIPMVSREVKGVVKYDIDKDWLYTSDLHDSCLLIDECRTIWPARSYAKWTLDDEEFFNFIRRYNMHVFLATQAYDGVDLNVRRACDTTLYLTKSSWRRHVTHIEESVTTIAKVADTQTEVLGRRFKQGMRKVQWDVVECPTRSYKFKRKKYYGDYDSFFVYEKKKEIVPVPWNQYFDFENKSIIPK